VSIRILNKDTHVCMHMCAKEKYDKLINFFLNLIINFLVWWKSWCKSLKCCNVIYKRQKWKGETIIM